MQLDEAIRDAMRESICNAEQWLVEARLIAQNGSLSHACVLRDLAGEEIAKAFVCWQVLVGALPANHPLVRPNKKESVDTVLDGLKQAAEVEMRRIENGKPPKKEISVFASHSMKYALITDLASQFATPPEQNQPTEEAEAYLNALKVAIGEFGVLKKQEWLYVNLMEDGDVFATTSPLKGESQVKECNLVLQVVALAAIKSLSGASTEAFTKWAESKRRKLGKDLYMPQNPVWLGPK